MNQNQRDYNPQVTLPKDEFDEIMGLAIATDKQIKQKALELWQNKGAARINVEIYLRRHYIGSDEIVKSYQFSCKPENVHVYPAEGHSDNKMAISRTDRNKISKFASNVANDIFLHVFGDRLARINEIQKMKADMRREWRITRACTITGWLVALALAVILIV